MEIEGDIQKELKAVDEKIALAEKEQGDLEVRDALVEKAEIYRRHKDSDNFRTFLQKAIDKTIGTAKKLDFYLMILHSYFLEDNIEKFAEHLKICKKLNEEGGDWEKKNKLLVYEGIVQIIKKDLSGAANTFLSCVNTFNAPEILPYETLVAYGVLLGTLTLPRKDVSEKIVGNSEVLAVLFENKTLYDFVFSLYQSKYSKYFESFINLHESLVVHDKYLKAHDTLIIKRARIIVYSQYLESYRTVTLQKMASDFGVSVEFLDKELSELIASRKLNCKIDKIAGVVESIKKDDKISLFRQITKKGDLLVERLAKLNRMAQL